MRKIISLFLSVFLVVFIIVSPVHAADTPNSTNTVEIPCQALNGNTVTEMTVDGIISDNTCYVSLETIAQLTGAEYVDGTNTLFFRKEQTENSDYYTGNSGAYLAYLFDPEQSILEEYSGFFQNRNWKIPTMKLEDGKTLVSLDHILSAMNVTMMVNPSSEIPLVLFRPYTVLDAYRMIIRNSNALFSWSEVDSGITTEDLKKMNQLSVLNSLFFDYSSHIATDAIFATWSDEILTVSEEQYQDAMIEVLSSFSTVDPSVTDSIDYETFTLQGDVSGITSNLAELIGIKDLAKVSEIASTGIEHASILVEAFSNALLYEQIADSEVNLLRNAFLQNRSQSIFDEPDLETVRNAASHLQTILDGGAESFWTQVADTLVEICAAVVSQLPSLTVINVATTITSLLPGMSENIDQNNAFLIALNCTNLDAFCRYDYTVLANQLRTEGPSSQVLSGMKDTLMFSLQSTYCARELMIKYNVCTSDVSTRLKESNATTLETIFFLQNCSTNMVGDEIDYQYKQWDTYVDNIKNSEKEESQAGKYFGTWEADPNATMELTGNSLMSVYGSGIKYGSEIIIREDGFFSFYIGITADNQGEGSWTWNGNGFDYTLTSTLNQAEVQGDLTIVPYNGTDYLVMNDRGKDIYWRQTNSSVESSVPSSENGIKEGASANLSDSNPLDFISGAWDSYDGDIRLIFNTTGLNYGITMDGIQSADGTMEIINLQEVERTAGSFTINENSLSFVAELQEENVPYSYNDGTLKIGNVQFHKVDLTLINQLIGTWKGDNGTIIFGDKNEMSLFDNDNPEMGLGYYVVLNESELNVRIDGDLIRAVPYHITGTTLEFNGYTLYKDGTDSSFSSTEEFKQILIGTWARSGTDIQDYYTFRDDGTYEYYSTEGSLKAKYPSLKGFYEIQDTETIYLYPDRTSLPIVWKYDSENGLNPGMNQYYHKLQD